MTEYVKKADVLEIINSPLPRDIAVEHLYELKGVWIDEEDNDLLDALDSVTWYNGLAEEIIEWKNLPKDNFGIAYPGIDNPQIEVIWMICCVLFGDYGTSPRSGWITDITGFHEFIEIITKTQQEHNKREVDSNGNI